VTACAFVEALSDSPRAGSGRELPSLPDENYARLAAPHRSKGALEAGTLGRAGYRCVAAPGAGAAG